MMTKTIKTCSWCDEAVEPYKEHLIVCSALLQLSTSLTDQHEGKEIKKFLESEGVKYE